MPGSRLLRGSLLLLIVLGTPGFTARAADRPAQINVAYFQQWPAPVQFAQARQTFGRVLGLRVNWLPFDNSRQMADALGAGDVQIAYSLGQVPFLAAIDRGLDLRMVAVAVGYPDHDNCIVRADAGIDRHNPAALQGQNVALRVGSVSHFRLNAMLRHLGVDPARVKILPARDGAEALQSLSRGDAVMACAHGASLRAMAALGEPLLSGAELEALGLLLFDTVAVTPSFAGQHADLLRAFLQVTDAANRQWRQNPDSMRSAIARASRMNRSSANHVLQRLHFPLAAEQKTDAWMGAAIADYSAELARFFVRHGQLESSMDTYEHYVTTRFLP